MRSPALLSFLAAVLLSTGAPLLSAQSPLRIDKIDPPNWYAQLPKPFLLIRGEGLTGARFQLSDPALKIERTEVSANGHWAQLWLSASPAAPETIKLQATSGPAHADMPYTFAARRPAASGMAGFNPADVMYLIMTDRFADGNKDNDGPLAQSAANSPEAATERSKPMGWHGGDLRGIEQHIDYMQSLGATAVWPTPVYQNHSPVAYHGYHATDYYAVDEHYGTMADLQHLAAALHAHGMKLLLDTVPNHIGPLHPWVNDSPTPTWFHGTAAQHVQAEYNFDALVNQHAPQRDRDATLHGWFVNELPDMNTDDPTVAQYLRQNIVWWIEQTGADALRIDTFPYVNREFWHDLNVELRALYPHLTEVGEVSNGDPEITSGFADGVTRSGVDTGLYTPFDFPLYHATRNVFANGAPMTRLSRVLFSDVLYPHPERLVPFLGNHDESRFAGAVTDPTLRRIAYAFLMTTRGTPQLYSGDEIAMPGGGDPDNRRDFPGGFPNSKQDAFQPAQRTPEQSDLFNWIQDLAALRRTHPALACGAEQILQVSTDTLVYTRTGTAFCPDLPNPKPQDRTIVAIQRGTPTPITLDLHQTAVTGCHPTNALKTAATATTTNDQLQLDLAGSVGIFACQ